MIKQMTAEEYSKINKEDYQIIDVREENERQICQIGGVLIPLKSLPSKLADLDKNLPTIVYCKFGGRSQNACEYLENAGFSDLTNLIGGTMGYSEIDNSVAKY